MANRNAPSAASRKVLRKRDPVQTNQYASDGLQVPAGDLTMRNSRYASGAFYIAAAQYKIMVFA
ncbi:hypothetical protein [Maricaulis sp.]|uniref:hypothetical protein n=1 Tax=Maricaulis sp. TaxID=1486257 RepID=UPI0025C2B3F3|nr:hypothetical protein [Maricaulis sp.]